MKLLKNKRGILPLLALIPLMILAGVFLILGITGMIAFYRFLKIAVPIIFIFGLAFFVYWAYLKLVKKEDIKFKTPKVGTSLSKILVTGTIIVIVGIYFIAPDILPGPVDDFVVAVLGYYTNKFITKKLK